MVHALVVAALAAGVDPSAEQQAADHFARGLKAYDKGNFEAARAEFTAAYQLTGSWEVLLNIGVAEENLLHYNEAVHALERYLGEGGDKVPPDRRTRVESELRQIRTAVGEVTVTVRGSGAPASVEVDGRVVGASPLPEPLLLAAGTHKLRAARAGDTPAEVTVEVRVGDKTEVALAPAPPIRRATTADLAIESHPAGAALTIDGRPVGAAPWKQTLGEGSYELAATLPGHRDANLRVDLRGGIAKNVRLELPDLPPPPPPWWRHWYVAAGVGAVVAAGAAFGIYQAIRPHYDLNIHPQP